jgi:hypothetical protein
MNVVKTEPSLDSETCLSLPLSEAVIGVKLEVLPVAVIKTETDVSYISYAFFISLLTFMFFFSLCNPILFTVCTSTFSKLCINVYNGM